MLSGRGSNTSRPNRGTHWLAALLCGWLSAGMVFAGNSPAWDIEQLMQTLAGVEQRQARFTETRELSLLQQALTSEGTLFFQRPDTLVKQFDPPQDLRYEIDAQRLTIRHSDGTEEVLRLDNAPRLLAYVAALRAVLAGDREELQRYFELQFEGGAGGWRLRLTPREPGLARQVREVTINGVQGDIREFTLWQQGGDRITTRLHPADAE